MPPRTEMDDTPEAETTSVERAEEPLRYPDPIPHVRRSAFLEDFSHAGVRVHENQ